MPLPCSIIRPQTTCLAQQPRKEKLTHASGALNNCRFKQKLLNHPYVCRHAVPQSKMMGTGNGSDASPEMVALLSEDEITPANYGAVNGRGDIEDADAEGSEGRKKKKKGKKTPQKEVADALKTDMAAERTFFKWLWTGLHTGAIGSFIFVTFDTDKTDPKRLVVVGFAWVVAFVLVLYGTLVYYRRRRALRSGRLDDVPRFTREHSPLVVVVALALVVGAAMTYAMVGERNKDASLPGFAP